MSVLESLRCPDVRRGEGTDEWKNSKGSFQFTPDLVAGPLIGGGHPSDFYIDVLEPSGDPYVKPKAGNPAGADLLLKTVASLAAESSTSRISGSRMSRSTGR
jgi:hypothetical protein